MSLQTRRFAQVDVFTAMPLLGNALAVVIDGEGLSDGAMASFARWTNLSETTFLLPPTDPAADYRVRIFTPGGELPFAGHPTLGSAHCWLAHGGVPKTKGVVVQECAIGLVKLKRSGPAGKERLAFAAPPLKRSGPVEPELGRVKRLLDDRAARHDPHPRGRGDRELVEAVVAPEHQAVVAPFREHAGHERSHARVGAADRDGRRRRGIRQRAEEVERGRDAEGRPRGTDVPERGVEHPREAERDAGALVHLEDAVGRHVQTDPEGLQHVGRAAGARRGSVAVLHDTRAGARRHDRRHRGDIDRVGEITAGAHDVEDAVGDRQPDRRLEHLVGQRLELGARLALGAEGHREAGDLRVGGLAVEDLSHRPPDRAGLEVAACGQGREDGGPRVRHAPSLPYRPRARTRPRPRPSDGRPRVARLSVARRRAGRRRPPSRRTSVDRSDGSRPHRRVTSARATRRQDDP